MENMDLGVSDSENGAKFDPLQISGNQENPVKSDAQVIVVSAPSSNSSFDIPFTQLRTMDGQAIDIGQLGMLNTQSLQLSSVVGGSGLGEITIMGTLMASQAGDGNQLNLVPSVTLNTNDTDETQGMSTEQNYAFTPIQNVFNVIGIPQGGDQTEIYPTNLNCDQTLPSQSSPETTLSEEVKMSCAETSGMSEESGNVVQNVQLSWQEASSMRRSSIQLVIPEEIAALDQASNSETGTPKFQQNLEINRLPNPKYVSLLSSKSAAEKGKADKLQHGIPSYNGISGGRQRAEAMKTQEEEENHWPTDTEDLEKKSKNQIYSMVLDQLLNQHSALVEMIDICQTVNSSESVQFEKAVRIFTEKLSSLLEFLGIVKTVIDNCLGRELKVDQSTQTEEGDESINQDIKPPVYSSVSGRKIRQTERFQGFLEQENGSTVSSGPQFENKPQIRKRKKKGNHQNCDSIQENVGKVEEMMLNTESKTPPPTSVSDPTETLVNDVAIPNGTEQLDFVAPEEKEKIYLNGCDRNGLDDASNWVKHPTNLDVGTVRSDGGLKRKTFKTKKQYEAEAQFKFFCQQCSFKSKRSSHFSRHLELHEKFTELYTCKLCNFKTIRQSTLRKHEINHSSSQVRCKECPYVTDSDILLKRHVNIKHSSRKRRHRKEKSLTYIYNCPHCGETVPNLAKYRLHLKMHNVDTDVEELTYQCDQCPYKTKRKEHMKRHRMNHSADRPHLCDTCGMTFKRSDTLNQHKQVHLEKVQRKLNFPCQICKKAFRSKCHLAEHMAMHSNSRQFLCDICGASFKTKSCQLKHVKNIHQNPRSFPCQVCEKRFNTNYALKRHERTHENDLKMMTASTNVLVAQNFLTDVSAQGINQAELVQATDIIIAPSMDETYEQSNDVKLQQVLSENNSAIMFLSSSLPTSWS